MKLGSIDRRDDRSPYRQIAEHLRAAIDSGDLRPGDRLPSEAELTQHYGVARMTARQAIQELRTEGRVVAEHGRGVFVQLPAPVRRLASDRFARKHRQAGKAAFLAEAEKAGVSARVDQIEVDRIEPRADVRERLHLDGGERVMTRSRRYLADGRPVELADPPAASGRLLHRMRPHHHALALHRRPHCHQRTVPAKSPRMIRGPGREVGVIWR